MRKTKLQEAIDNLKEKLGEQQRLLDALESIQRAQTTVKRQPKERKKRGGGEAATTVSGNYQP